MANLQSGMRAPETGVYEVEHGPHRLVHQVTIAADEMFPKCQVCGTAVRFKLVRPMEQTAWASNPFTYPLVPYDSSSGTETENATD